MQPANHATLPPTADGAPARAWTPAPELAPADAQRALLPSAGDVGGLDGAWYAPAAPGAPGAPPDPEGAGPSLGTLRDLSWGTDQPPERLAGGPRQLRLDLDEWAAVPTLSSWARRRTAAALADRAGVSSASDAPQDNLAKCCHGVAVPGKDPSLCRTERGRLSWSGVVRCKERMCPTCGPRWAQATAHKTSALIDRWLHGDGTGLTDPDAWMLTIAPPHAADELLSVVVDDLHTIADAFFECPAWRAFALRFGLAHVDERGRYRAHAALVSFDDATFGGAGGAHPHLHILALPSAAKVTGAERREAARLATPGPRPDVADELPAWERRAQRIADDQARALDPSARWLDAPLSALDAHERGIMLDRLAVVAGLLPALRDIVQAIKPRRPAPFGRGLARGELVPVAVSAAALRLTPGEDAARYFAAWGLADELGAAMLKDRTHLRVLDAAAAGVPYAGATWRAYREAMRGRQWARGLGAALRRLGITADDVAAHAAAEQRRRDERVLATGPLPLVRPLSVVVPRYLYGAALVVGLEHIEAAACAAADQGEDAQAAVLALCWRYQEEAHRRARGRPPPS